MPVIGKGISLTAILGLIFTSSLVAGSEKAIPHLSFQGYTGYLNVPSSQVIQEAHSAFFINNLVTRVEKVKDPGNRSKASAENYLLTFGLIEGLELNGRLTEQKSNDTQYTGMRDLSASFKYQLPLYLTGYKEYLPDISIGAQDIGGAASNLQATYVTLGKTLGPIRADIGYGKGPDRLKGVFGGAELNLWSWVTLQADYDGLETHVGGRINIPKRYLKFVDLSLHAMSGLEDTDRTIYFGASVMFSLGDSHNVEPLMSHQVPQHQSDDTPVQSVDNATGKKRKAPWRKSDLQKRLVSLGLENVSVELNGKLIRIAIENGTFDHNLLDAIGASLGMLHDAPAEMFDMIILHSDMTVAALSGNLSLWKRYMRHPSVENAESFSQSMLLRYGVFDEERPVSTLSDSWMKTRITLSPGIVNFVGTEVGVYDYVFSLKALASWNLWRGLDASVGMNFPFMHSENVHPDTGVYRRSYPTKGIEDAMIHYTTGAYGLFNMISAGQYRTRYYGLMDQIVFIYDNHTFKFKGGYFENRIDGRDIRKVALGSYRYFYAPLEMSIKATAGGYWAQDEGFDIRLERFFGDTRMGLFYQHGDTDYAGIEVELPLTPRQSYNSRWLQIKGTRNFNYFLRSTVRREDGTNSIVPGGMVEPKMPFELERDFINRDRLNLDYLRNNVKRLRNAAFTFGRE